jgi:uncharacterized membrane protein YhaH (DUF805 family)
MISTTNYAVDAAKPTDQQVPALTLTVVISFFFGVFGFIPALIHAKRARSLGASGGRYWAAWLITWVLTLIIVAAL